MATENGLANGIFIKDFHNMNLMDYHDVQENEFTISAGSVMHQNYLYSTINIVYHFCCAYATKGCQVFLSLLRKDTLLNIFINIWARPLIATNLVSKILRLSCDCWPFVLILIIVIDATV